VLFQHKRLYYSIVNVISATTGDPSTYCPSGHAPAVTDFSKSLDHGILHSYKSSLP